MSTSPFSSRTSPATVVRSNTGQPCARCGRFMPRGTSILKAFDLEAWVHRACVTAGGWSPGQAQRAAQARREQIKADLRG